MDFRLPRSLRKQSQTSCNSRDLSLHLYQSIVIKDWKKEKKREKSVYVHRIDNNWVAPSSSSSSRYEIIFLLLATNKARSAVIYIVVSI